MKPSIPKGTRDFGPAIMAKREYIFDTIKAVFKKYGYAPIQTPSMEKLDVLTGKYGEEGDRLIFKILDNGDFLTKVKPNDLANPTSGALAPQICSRALRYDLTVPFARFVAMNQNTLSFPFKRYQIQPVWRADRPQKGRYREFYQCDADVVGSTSLLFEAEFIAMFDEALSNLGFDDFQIVVSNRKILSAYAEIIDQQAKFGDICVAIDKIDKIGEAGVKTELQNRGIPVDAIEKLFEIILFNGTNQEKINFLREKFSRSETGLLGLAEMEEVLETYSSLDNYQGTVIFDLLLARGLDYYTGTIYEVKAPQTGIGSLCGGGRYDDLTGVFGGKGISGVGISFGADRIYDAMTVLDLFKAVDVSAVKVLLINFGAESLKANLSILNELRRNNISAELYPEAAKLKKQFSYANKREIPYTIMVGSEEIESGLFKLKNMESGEQEMLNLSSLSQKLSV